ncbi:TfoX/Sxy family DNA transformation protein [Mariprofundus sp. KV]|uniref:TfoX/Sxy family DNA transformation protein n=1 Tax=Mariprofundus sp. KV TaxID=2608715 RepID=UPI0015A3DAE3|nr:TfoX/Sxy family DNA transformation protein [Mariprofundus sp. KV]NWF36092.1 competence protein TfoX [Mariprofundus sp. KV]
MRNIGKVSRTWLRAIELHTLDDLKRCGSVATYRMIKSMQPQATLNLLRALEGAILDIDWRHIPSDRKDHLLKSLQQNHPDI